ncbi:MAG: serine--tRNA ligase [Burkholderia sp.]|nr:serine--tRNA ligase [Burkholderia sp.]
MLDIQLLRKDINGVAARLADRGYMLDVTMFSTLEAERRAIQINREKLQAQRNNLSKKIGVIKTMSGKDTSSMMADVCKINNDMKASAIQLNNIQNRLTDMMLEMPNLAHSTVPVGNDESRNIEERRWTFPELHKFDFFIKDHVDIGIPLGLDFETGAKLSGARFTMLRGQIAHLHRALTQFMLDMHTQQHGYIEIYTPYIVNSDILYGAGQLPKFKDDMFRVEKGGGKNSITQYLISTSEIPLINTVRNSIIDISELPIKLTAHSPCFRSEAGSYGQDSRGIIRQHQFDKIEIIQVTTPDSSYLALNEMVSHAETILQKLGLSYRVITLCTKEMGFSASKTFDLEVWLPARKTYREISSCSNTEEFQARRIQARFRNIYGELKLVHTLNGSGLAVGRTLAAVLENYQNIDGSVTVPEALRPYMGGMEKINARKG